jgi:hypothetical protein
MQRLNLIGVDRQWTPSIDDRKGESVLWNSINWRKAKQIVNGLQTRIVKAVKAGNKKKVRKRGQVSTFDKLSEYDFKFL